MLQFVATSEFFDLALLQAERLATLDTADLVEDMGEMVEEQTRDRFDTKEGPDGQPWVDWTPAYAAWRAGRGDGKLILGGDLLDSIHMSATDSEATIGSELIYAGYHQNPSARSRRRGAKARPYLGISLDDRSAIESRVGEFLMDAMVP